MRVVTAAQMTELDRRAREEYGIPVSRLMDAAGRRVAQAAQELLGVQGGRRVFVLAGKGNNGGDGLVAARYLRTAGFDVRVLLTASQGELGGEPARALATATNAGVTIQSVPPSPSGDELAREDLIIDALFGTGFHGPVRGEAAALIDSANHSAKPILAVDVPSGLDADTGRWEGSCIRAAATVTMGFPKIGLLVYPGAEMAGTVYVADIGYPAPLRDDPSIPTHVVTVEMIRALLSVRRPDTHKGTYGRVLIIAGSVGFTGAAALATLGALRAGSGLVVVGVPQSVYSIIAAKVTEGMPTPLPDASGALAPEAVSKIEELAAGADAIAVGPGLSRASGVLTVVEALLAESRPLVIDADGLNVLAGRSRALERAHAMAVLTPHPGELARLTGVSASEVQRDRLQAARSAAARFKSIVTLKGARTIVATPEGEAFIVPTGNPGMATGGMGDVLTGAVASFIGQGLPPTQAAYAAAYIHGLAADLIAGTRGTVGMLASEVADHFPLAIQQVQAGRQADEVRELRD
ncbi:MAG TPA: NAD(P)H-hydrate dehydratase [bacterium]|nr:NAD(P)H-hydrate dehydratase [bacterium]